jgi:hypothetical protein
VLGHLLGVMPLTLQATEYLREGSSAVHVIAAVLDVGTPASVVIAPALVVGTPAPEVIAASIDVAMPALALMCRPGTRIGGSHANHARRASRRDAARAATVRGPSRDPCDDRVTTRAPLGISWTARRLLLHLRMQSHLVLPLPTFIAEAR